MIVIIIGMHRSGTSAIAGLLHKNNIIMGEDKNFKPKSNPQNPKGFYENYLFRKINDNILQKNKYDIKSWDTNIPLINHNFIDEFKMKRLINKYIKKYENWGWKDPRNCLTLHIWLSEIDKMNKLKDTRIIYIFRKPEAVTKSMYNRKDTDLKTAFILWKVYNKRALKTINDFGVNSFFFRYEDLCENPVIVSQKLFNFLGLLLDKTSVSKFVDKKLQRSDKLKFLEHVDNDIIKGVEEVENELVSYMK